MLKAHRPQLFGLIAAAIAVVATPAAAQDTGGLTGSVSDES